MLAHPGIDRQLRRFLVMSSPSPVIATVVYMQAGILPHSKSSSCKHGRLYHALSTGYATVHYLEGWVIEVKLLNHSCYRSVDHD
jgi:hypothetical protein